MKSLLVLSLLVFASFANAEIFKCPDGSVRAATPFNPRPCEVGYTKLAKPVVPPLFEKIYGKRPVSLSGAVDWDQNLRLFAFAEKVPADVQATFDFYIPEFGDAYVVFFNTGGGVLKFENDNKVKGNNLDLASVSSAYMVAANKQMQLLRQGRMPKNLHPVVSNWLFNSLPQHLQEQ